MSRYLVLLAIFLIPAYIFRFLVFGLPTNVFEITVGIALLVFIIERLLVGSRLRGNDKRLLVGFWPNYLLVFFAAVSIIFSPDKTTALGIWKGWFFVPAILYFLIINNYKKNNIRRIAIPIFINLLIVSLWATLQKLGVISTLFYQTNDPGFYDYLARFRSFGPFESPNYLAMYVVPAGIFSFTIFDYFQKKIDRTLILIMFLLPLYALYTSKSLGGLLAFGFGLLSFLAFGMAKTYKAKMVDSGKKIALWIIGLIVTAVVLAFVFSSIGNDTYSNNIRMDIYRYAAQLIKANPVFGIGMGQFQSAVASISTSNSGFVTYGLSYALHPHNLYLAFWLNIGILGLLSFIYILGSFFWNLGRRGGEIFLMAGAFASMVAIMIHGLVDTTYFKNDLSALFWLLLATGSVIGRRQDA
ncbi:MAG: O-antigen ligase family protein [Patescibacteria group bacterium]|jgi:putative inorganic carbon (HCO3(-)) transporter